MKSPLVTITGFLGLLGKDIAANETDRIEDDIERVNHALSTTMRTLLDDLLELSRIGQVRGELVTCNLSEIAKQGVGTGWALIVDEIQGLRLLSMICQRLKPTRQDLAEVYQNLFENADQVHG